ncbi:MAG: hypothetical protein ABGY71_09715 [bacterium]|nr:hypothetical protein [Planctomycetota bacterium]
MMRRGGGRVIAALIVLMALLARESRLLPLSADGPRPFTGHVESAWRLHRISLAISSPRLVQRDRALSFPGDRSLTQLPVHDEVMALGVRLCLGLWSEEFGRLPDRGELQELLRALAPLLAAATLALCYGWLRSGDRCAPAPALAGLALVAFLPGFVELGLPGRVSIEAFAGLGLLLACMFFSGLWRSSDVLDSMTWAMVAGGVVGLGLATSPLFLAPLAAACAVFALQLVDSHGEERQTTARTGLLFWISAALVSQLPALGGPWLPAEEGIIAEWSALLGGVFLLWVLPLVILGTRREVPRGRALWLVGLCALAWVAVLAFSEAARAVLTAPKDVVASDEGPRLAAQLGAAVGLAILCRWTFGARGNLTSEERFLAIMGGLGLVGALFAPSYIVLGIAPLALAAARLAQRARPRLAILAVAAALCTASLLPGTEPGSVAAGNREVARASAWLEAHTQAPGAWGSATAVLEWAVGIEPERAPQLLWHGRRAAAGFGERWAKGSASADLDSVRRAANLEDFIATSRAVGLRYWILTPRSARRLGWSEELAAALEDLRRGSRASQADAKVLWRSRGPVETAVCVLELVPL